MFYLIGLGMNEGDISIRARQIIEKADAVYVENYTSIIDFKIEAKLLDRAAVESEKFLDEAKEKNIVLLVPGDPLSATTHFQLILACERKGIPWDVIHAPSIFTLVAETGLHLYKFGKTTTLPKPLPNYNPKSYLEVISKNDEISAHTLLLVDPELDSEEAVEILISDGLAEREAILCSKLGTTNRKVFFGKLKDLKMSVSKPFCIIIPNLNALEEEALRIWERKGEGERSS